MLHLLHLSDWIYVSVQTSDNVSSIEDVDCGRYVVALPNANLMKDINIIVITQIAVTNYIKGGDHITAGHTL